jgi:hypothetical protein
LVTPDLLGGAGVPFSADTHEYYTNQIGESQTLYINIGTYILDGCILVIDSAGNYYQADVIETGLITFPGLVINNQTAVTVTANDNLCIPLSPTPTQTPTNTPSPTPVTGYSFNLIQLPYNFPSTGNTIMNDTSPSQTGTTNPNELTISSRGIYFNTIDSDGVDRTDYFSAFTGQSITITLSQTGSTAIYSGDTNAFKYWTGSTGNPPYTLGDGFVFGTGIGLPPDNIPSGNAVLIQSASTNWVSGQTVYISAVINGG